MKKIVKRILVGVLIAALSCGGLYGALIAYRNTSATSVKVYSVTEIASNSYYYDDSSSMSYGTVSSDRMQSVFLSSTMSVTDLKVSVGDTVKKGDVLFTYDTTLTEIQVERADLDLQGQQLSLKRAKEDLERLKTLRPSSTDPGSGDGSGEEPEGPASSTEEPVEDYESEQTPQLISDGEADGSMAAPYVYLWSQTDPLTQTVLLQMFAPGQTILLPEEQESGDEPADSETEPLSPEDGPELPTGGDTDPADTDERPDAEPETEDGGDEDPSGDEYYPDDEYADDDAYEDDTVSGSGEPAPAEEAEVTDEGFAGMSRSGLPAGSFLFSVEHVDAPQVRLASAEVDVQEAEAETAPSAGGVRLEELPSELYVVLEVHKMNNRDAEVLHSYGLHLFRTDEQVAVTLYQVSDESSSGEEGGLADSEAELPEGGGGADFSGGYDGGNESGSGEDGTSSRPSLYSSDIDWTAAYTAKEIAQMKESKEKDVRDMTISVAKAEISLREMKAELTDGSVKAKFDGEIKTVRDPEDVRDTNSAVVVVSGGGGYFVTFSLGELELPQIETGAQVMIESYDTGMNYAGTIRSISDYPASGDGIYYYGGGNPLSTSYPATVQVEKDAELRDGDFVSVQYSTGAESVSGLFLDQMFIRSEDGQRYVYVKDEEGILRKRTVVTGRILMDTYIQIRGGLTTDDWIAFPYGSGVKDGAKTTEAEYMELYS